MISVLQALTAAVVGIAISSGSDLLCRPWHKQETSKFPGGRKWPIRCHSSPILQTSPFTLTTSPLLTSFEMCTLRKVKPARQII
ncbi:hypothetical protein GALMADRAFT_709990 [Galerina marginata CBS 339.88]|uniref:Secreted protein n=1 Tax=Galerina marginata (strain CBS 339.88) TaxID=685588 RepID=A0A067TZ70_GALM3|nr:hypothetical protein GALMADRAFT_709990 [Galerina marginata CBS 339.88]